VKVPSQGTKRQVRSGGRGIRTHDRLAPVAVFKRTATRRPDMGSDLRIRSVRPSGLGAIAARWRHSCPSIRRVRAAGATRDDLEAEAKERLEYLGRLHG
jgi:hypothetical protein